MEATDREGVEPRLSYAVHGSVGGGGTRHTKATVRLFKKCSVFEQSEEKSEVFFLKSELLAMTVQ